MWGGVDCTSVKARILASAQFWAMRSISICSRWFLTINPRLAAAPVCDPERGVLRKTSQVLVEPRAHSNRQLVPAEPSRVGADEGWRPVAEAPRGLLLSLESDPRGELGCEACLARAIVAS